MKKSILTLLFFVVGLSTVSAQVINEIRIDQPSSDNDEYFEISAPAGTSLSGLHYIVIGDGATGSGTIESVIDLMGLSVPADGFFFAAEGTFTLNGAMPDLTTTLNFENSDNVTHLLVSAFTGTNGDDLDTDDDGVLDATPWSGVVDCIALIESVGSGDQTYCGDTIGPDGTFVPSHIYRLPNGLLTWNIGVFSTTDAAANDTPGESNVAPLPVELTDFNATSFENSIAISWQTASEINNSGFAIEMSSTTNLGMESWTELSFVTGHGNTVEIHDYSYEVSGVDPGSYQLRLKQIDFDGSFNYSTIITAVVETPNAIDLIEAYPNPFNPSTNFSFVLAEEQDVKVVVFDQMGRQVATLFEGIVAAQIRQEVQFNSGNLPSGTYLIHVSGNQSLATFPVILVK